MSFNVNTNDIIYTKTRLGVNARAPIRNTEGIEVGDVDDRGESIVAPVRFITPEVRAEFLREARGLIPESPFGIGNDEYRISEYARKLLEDAEQRVVTRRQCH
ncbi:hypothetical protein [Caballeronia glebae]|jgi:hypothetical protein|uniref:hypothetical protein n=1 Tax=Caballeronia glebae TaxID=1777143 RepID=UPI0038BA13C0